MRANVKFDCTAWDTAPLSPKGPTHFFVESSQENFSSATDTDERRLVESLLSDRLTRRLVFRALSLPDETLWAACVVEPFTTHASKPGDVDVLLASPVSPQHAVAGEAKWVKVRRGTDGTQRMNKLVGAADSADQVAGLVTLGFSRTFLVLMAVVDDRSDVDSNFLFRGTSVASLRRIVEFSDAVALDPAAGILYIEVSQPVAKNVKHSAMVCAGILRPARYREQSVDVTSMVRSYITPHGRGA